MGDELPDELPINLSSCLYCGKPIPEGELRCPSCRLLVGARSLKRVPWRFDLGAGVWLIATIAVGLAFLREAPGLAVPWLLIVPATIVRSSAIYNHRRSIGWTARALAMTDVFLDSLWRVVVIVVLAAITFVAVCTPVGFCSAAVMNSAGNFLIPAVLAGGIAVIVLLATLGRSLYPPKD